MDDYGYESPSDDGHGSIPSPNSTMSFTDTSDSRFSSPEKQSVSQSDGEDSKTEVDTTEEIDVPLQPVEPHSPLEPPPVGSFTTGPHYDHASAAGPASSSFREPTTADKAFVNSSASTTKLDSDPNYNDNLDTTLTGRTTPTESPVGHTFLNNFLVPKQRLSPSKLPVSPSKNPKHLAVYSMLGSSATQSSPRGFLSPRSEAQSTPKAVSPSLKPAISSAGKSSGNKSRIVTFNEQELERLNGAESMPPQKSRRDFSSISITTAEHESFEEIDYNKLMDGNNEPARQIKKESVDVDLHKIAGIPIESNPSRFSHSSESPTESDESDELGEGDESSQGSIVRKGGYRSPKVKNELGTSPDQSALPSPTPSPDPSPISSKHVLRRPIPQRTSESGSPSRLPRSTGTSPNRLHSSRIFEGEDIPSPISLESEHQHPTATFPTPSPERALASSAPVHQTRASGIQPPSARSTPKQTSMDSPRQKDTNDNIRSANGTPQKRQVLTPTMPQPTSMMDPVKATTPAARKPTVHSEHDVFTSSPEETVSRSRQHQSNSPYVHLPSFSSPGVSNKLMFSHRNDATNKTGGNQSSVVDEALTLRRRVAQLERQVADKENYEKEMEEDLKTHAERIKEIESQHQHVLAENAEMHQTITKLISETAVPESVTATNDDGSETVTINQETTVAQLYAKIGSCEKEISKLRLEKRHDKEDSDRTIVHLREALTQSQRTRKNKERELENKILDEREKHSAELEQKDAELRELITQNKHLQSELDEYVNKIPVDESMNKAPLDESMRFLTEEHDATSWMEEKSMALLDRTMDHFIKALHDDNGASDHDVHDPDDSLLALARQNGVTGDVSKDVLVKMGIDKMKEEMGQLKHILQDNEKQMKKMTQDSEETITKLQLKLAKTEEDLQESQRSKIAFENNFNKAQKTAKALESDLTATKVQLTNTSKSLTDALKEIHESNQKASQAIALQSELDRLRSTCQSVQLEFSTAEARVKELESERFSHVEELARLRTELKSQEQNIQHLRWELNETNSKLSKAEIDLTRTSSNLTTHDSQLAIIQQHLTTERENNQKLKKQHIEATSSAKKTEQQLQDLNAIHKAAEEKLAELERTLNKVQTEKRKLEFNLDRTEGDRKLARERFDNLMRDMQEKEKLWGGNERSMFGDKTHLTTRPATPATPPLQPISKSVVEQVPATKETTAEREGSVEEAVNAYAKTLHRIAAELDPAAASQPDDDKFAMIVSELMSDKSNNTTHVPDTKQVANIIYSIRTSYQENKGLATKLSTLEVKYNQLKAAVKKWKDDKEANKSNSIGDLRAKLEKARKKIEELETVLRAERRSHDEKMGNLILALRR